MPAAGPVQDLGALYKHRKNMLRPTRVTFKSAYGRRNPYVVKVLMDLILGSSVAVCRSKC
jgi:hypothetical protein